MFQDVTFVSIQLKMRNNCVFAIEMIRKSPHEIVHFFRAKRNAIPLLPRSRHLICPHPAAFASTFPTEGEGKG